VIRNRGEQVIVMINGSFGVGKTTTAEKLLSLIPNSMVFDPEEVGYMLRKIVTEDMRSEEEKTDDFQDLELWRILVVKVANELKLKYNKHLIVPMTIYKLQNYEYIYNGFKNIDKELYHFCLIASEQTLFKRLTERGDKPGGWTFKQSEKCMNILRDNRFEEHIVTDNLDKNEIIDKILKRVSTD
jgi:tRNA uridine 5-carbamoylmethylation protein Kti12